MRVKLGDPQGMTSDVPVEVALAQVSGQSMVQGTGIEPTLMV